MHPSTPLTVDVPCGESTRDPADLSGPQRDRADGLPTGSVKRDPYDAYADDEHLPFEPPLTLRSMSPPEAEVGGAGGESDECFACHADDEEYVWVSERWRVRATLRPRGLPLVLGLEARPHLDLGDLPNLLAAELGVMTVRLEKAIRSLPGIAQVHVNRWGDGERHLRLWFLARPQGQHALRGPYLPVWDRVLPAGAEEEWRDRLGVVAAWLAEFGGRAMVGPARIAWRSLDASDPRGTA